MKQKLFLLLLAIVAGIGTMNAAIVNGTCGDNLTWSLNTKDSTLTIEGFGAMTSAPCSEYKTYIAYVSLPEGLTNIGDYAFTSCTGLTSITIPNSVTSIGSSAFYGCSGLTSITIGNGITSIESQAFYNCTNLTSVTIPSSVISIGNSAFFSCSGLTSVTIPNSVTSIGNNAFSFCTGLTSLTIPNSVTSIGNDAFYHIPNIAYNGTATGSPWGAMSINGYVEEPLVYSDNTKTTLLACFSAAIGEIIIPNSVTSIGDNAFDGCKNLTSVKIGNNVKSIGKYAFYYCTGLTNVTIGSSVTNIDHIAFSYCSALTSLTIPSSVTSIGVGVFNECSSLISIVVEEGNVTYDSRGNCNAIIKTSTNTLILGCKNTKIPNNVTNIEGGAFWGCTGLTNLVIPNSVTSIGSSAFSGCTGLKFLAIPNSVTSIGFQAFYNCSSLTSITNRASNPQTIDGIFYNVDKSTCTLHVPASSIDLYRTADEWKDFTNILPIAKYPEIETEEDEYIIRYMDRESDEVCRDTVTLHVPVAPEIDGFTFQKWQASGDLENGIILLAIYTANVPTEAPAIYTNPANPAQKLIRNGNVYILTGDKTYTIDGRLVR